MTAEGYLEWERQQDGKHEFHAGDVFALAGGSPRHNFLAGAVIAELRTALRESPCAVLSSDQRVAAAPKKRYVYPDALVLCEAPTFEAGTSDVLTNPAVIVEVLSPGTETYDRGDKWAAYQALPSVTDYLLIAQDSVRVEQFQRSEVGWRYLALGQGGQLRLSNGASVSVDAIYDGAFALPAAPAPATR